MKELTAIENKLLETATPYLMVMNNDVHTKEVVRFALELLRSTDGERDVVIPAAILHDVGWSQMPENLSIQVRTSKGDPEKIKIHEEKGALIAKQLIKQVMPDSVHIEEIVTIIQGHDTRAHAVSLNDKIVKDADKLARYAKTYFIYPGWKQRLGKNAFDVLERGIKEWFFLEKSKKIAKAKLHERRQENRASKQIFGKLKVA